MKILILGANGLIGKEIYKTLSEYYEVFGTYHLHKPIALEDNCLIQFNLDNINEIVLILKETNPDIIISTLRGDYKKQLVLQNKLTDYIKDSSKKIIYLSTANVFDGMPNKAYVESHNPKPASDYGAFKYTCEKILQDNLEDKNYLIVRLPHTYSYESLKTLISLVAKGFDPIFSNFYNSCNSIINVSKSLRFCIANDIIGIIHLTSTNIINQNDFLKLVLRKFNKLDLKYDTIKLNLELYSKAIGQKDQSQITLTDPDKFILALASENTVLPKEFIFTSEEIIKFL